MTETKIPQEAMGVNWPLAMYICQSCSRPTMFKEDKCCSGFTVTILVAPVGREIDTWGIHELDLPVRPYNNLARMGIRTVGELISKSPDEVQAFPNMGKKAMEDLMEALERHGLMLRENDNS